MTRPAVFFDRDNTLIVSDGYLGDPAGVELAEGAAEAVARVRAAGFAAVVFSNQSGVARGMFPEEAVHAVNVRLDELLQDHNHDAIIDRHEFCPYHPEGTVGQYRRESDLRKPQPGMIHQAAQALGLDLRRSWVIGDAPRDIEAGHAAGCRTILVRNASLKPSPAAEAATVVEPDFVVTSLLEAAEIIERAPKDPPAPGIKATSTDDDSVVSSPNGAPDAPAPDAPAPDAPAAEAPSPTPDTLSSPQVVSETAVAPLPEPPLTGAAKDFTRSRPRMADNEGNDRLAQLNDVTEQILHELRRRDEHHNDFSITKLLAGIVQVVALAALFMGYLRRDSFESVVPTLLTALVLQALTIALLIMDRQR